MSIPYRVRFRGMFYCYALYGPKGEQFYTLADAAKAAEEQYGDDWREVFNGEDGITRKETVTA